MYSQQKGHVLEFATFLIFITSTSNLYHIFATNLQPSLKNLQPLIFTVVGPKSRSPLNLIVSISQLLTFFLQLNCNVLKSLLINLQLWPKFTNFTINCIIPISNIYHLFVTFCNLSWKIIYTYSLIFSTTINTFKKKSDDLLKKVLPHIFRF